MKSLERKTQKQDLISENKNQIFLIHMSQNS